MNLAFSAVVLFVIFAPGLIFRRAYLSPPFSKRLTTTSASDEIAISVIPAIVLQVAGVTVAENLFHYTFDFPTIGVLVLGAHTDEPIAQAFAALHSNFWLIAGYNITLWVASGVLGDWFRRLVIGLDLDLRFSFLRFSNEWYYLLSGRLSAYESGKPVAAVIVDALVGNGDHEVVYSGVLTDYTLARDGSLDSLSLANVRKTLLGKILADERPERPAIPPAGTGGRIPGDDFIVKYAHVVNLNLAFFAQEPPALPRRA